ncbi:MAG: hypothetical protein QHC90_13860 [Shinella sp.]|nr:hypothetical protein [Shinella sp.]
MHKLTKRLALIGLLAILAGCNSTDALTPQVDVGNGGFRSPPVTQRDLDSMSADNRPVGAAQQNAMASSTTALAPPQGGSQTAGTLQEQADALANNQPNPTGQPESRQANQTPARQPQQAAAGETTQGQSAALPPTVSGGESIRFLPIIGAPVQAVTPLSRQLGAQARASGLVIKSASDNSSQYILKGYFSAINDNGKTTVIYVWDVLDGSGTRLHRIQGQDSVAATAADPWAAVPAGTMEAIAQKTIREYLDWRRQTRG